MNQKGFSPLSLLIIIVFGVFILWEANEYIGLQVNSGSGSAAGGDQQSSSSPTLCLTGEAGNCNDSNDQFLLP